MSKITFDIAVEIILEKEGGLVNDPNDKGGLTNFGISQQAYPKLDIEGLTKADAKAIYKRDYWDRVQAEKLPDSLRLTVFDMAVNAGVRKAIELLQTVAKVEVDGILGPITLSQAQHVGLEAYSKARMAHYVRICEVRPKNLKFLKGWINRVNAIEAETKRLLKQKNPSSALESEA